MTELVFFRFHVHRLVWSSYPAAKDFRPKSYFSQLSGSIQWRWPSLPAQILPSSVPSDMMLQRNTTSRSLDSSLLSKLRPAHCRLSPPHPEGWCLCECPSLLLGGLPRLPRRGLRNRHVELETGYNGPWGHGSHATIDT